MRLIDIAIWLFVVIILVFTIYFTYYQTTEGGKCINDPIGYAHEKIERINNMPVICSCVAFEPGRTITFCSDYCEGKK